MLKMADKEKINKIIIFKAIIATIVFYLINELLGLISIFLIPNINSEASIDTILWTQSGVIFLQKLILFILVIYYLKNQKIFDIFKIKSPVNDILSFKTILIIFFSCGFIIIQKGIYFLTESVIYGNGYTFFNNQVEEFRTWKIPLFLSTIILTPITEELFFRKYLLIGLKNKYNWSLAIAISSVLFSLAHLPNIYTSTMTLLGGLFIGVIYFKFKKIIYPIVFHAFRNNNIYPIFKRINIIIPEYL